MNMDSRYASYKIDNIKYPVCAPSRTDPPQ